MADRIKGITVEIGGDTTKLSDALMNVNKSIRETQDQLRDVNKLLKLDPGNADLLVQKQKYLSEAISDTKEKLKQEQDALKQLQEGPQTEETIKQQEALTREIESTKQSLEKLKAEFKDVGSVAGVQLQQAGQKMKDVGDKISGVGTSLSTHVTAPIAAVGAASLAAFKEVDEGADIVTQKTGASGKALKEMQDAANDIATSIPTDFATAGSAIGEVNTRFGLTGDKLKELSQQFVEFASLNDTDVSTSIDNVSSVLNAFGMDASQAGGMLDVLFITVELEAKRDKLMEEAQVIADAVQQSITENAHAALDQAAYQKHYDDLASRYDDLTKQIDELNEKIQKTQSQKANYEDFLIAFEKTHDSLTEFSLDAWSGLVDHLTVYTKDDIRVTFRNGQEIKA